MITLALAATALLFAPGCGAKDESTTATDSNTAAGTGSASFTLASTSLANRGDIPDKFACEDEGGSDRSPQLSWSNPPAGTASYAIVMDDETPPCGKGDSACMHWSVFNIPAGRTSLAEGEDLAAVSGIALGRNYTGANGYAGPCPPNPHVYKITVYALKEGEPMIKSGGAYTRSSFEQESGAFIIGSDTLEATFTP